MTSVKTELQKVAESTHTVFWLLPSGIAVGAVFRRHENLWTLQVLVHHYVRLSSRPNRRSFFACFKASQGLILLSGKSEFLMEEI
jgi:hypothetical protein